MNSDIACAQKAKRSRGCSSLVCVPRAAWRAWQALSTGHVLSCQSMAYNYQDVHVHLLRPKDDVLVWVIVGDEVHKAVAQVADPV